MSEQSETPKGKQHQQQQPQQPPQQAQQAEQGEQTSYEEAQEKGYLGTVPDELDHTITGQGPETAAAEREQLTKQRAEQQAASSEDG